MTDTPALRVENLSIRFTSRRGDLRVVEGVSFDVQPGEVLGLVGESGSGKSLTALAVLGLVPPPGIVTGSIAVAGEQVIGADAATLGGLRGSGAAMIFQNPGAALNPFFTIGAQLIEIVMQQRHMTKSAARDALIAAFSAAQLADPEQALTRYPHQLSGGQLQRVMIALAVACKPKVLIADEPTTALDVTIQAQIVATLRELAASQGLAILFITHDLGLLGTLCHRVAVMYAGALVEVSDVGVFFNGPQHPYSERLLATVPRLGQTGTLATIPGNVPSPSAPGAGCAFAPRCGLAQGLCQTQRPDLRPGPRSARVACHFPLAGAS